MTKGRSTTYEERIALVRECILTFTIDFETAKRYREANQMPHQFRRAAWSDLTVEVCRTRLMKLCLFSISPKCENSTMEKMYF